MSQGIRGTLMQDRLQSRGQAEHFVRSSVQPLGRRTCRLWPLPDEKRTGGSRLMAAARPDLRPHPDQRASARS